MRLNQLEPTLPRIEVGIRVPLALWALKSLTKLWDTISVDEERTRNRQLHSHLDCSINRGPILDPLVVRNVTSRTGDDNLTSPYFSGSGEDGTVRNRFLIPVCRHKIHVLAENDTAIVNGEGGAGAGKFLFYGDVSGIRQSLVGGHTGRDLDDLLVGARRMKVIALVKCPGLKISSLALQTWKKQASRKRTVCPAGCLRRTGIVSKSGWTVEEGFWEEEPR
jgi:hypothetical protein